MTFMEIAYGLSIGVIILIAFGAILHPEVPTGILGTLLLGSIVAAELASIERYGETPNWRAMLTITEAFLASYVAVKWYWNRR